MKKKKQHKLARTRVLFNTGTRVERPKKGKGAYDRKKSKEEG